MNYVRGDDETYLCLLPADPEHASVGYHRKRIGLNHLVFKAAFLEDPDRMKLEVVAPQRLTP